MDWHLSSNTYALTCLFLCSYGFVSYASVEEAKAVFDEQKDIKLDGKVLFIDFSEGK